MRIYDDDNPTNTSLTQTPIVSAPAVRNTTSWILETG